MASEGPELPAAAVRAIGKGIPADKVLMPHVELSPRERQFVQRMAEGAGKREAFIEAFEPGGTSRSVSTAAWKVAKRPEVQQALAQEKAVQRLRYSQNPTEIRNFVVDSLQHEARTAQRPSDRLRALELLGKLADVDAFQTRTVITHERGSDTTAKLKEKLARLGGVIDVEAHARTDAHEHASAGVHAHAQAHEGDPTQGEGAQSGGAGRGDSRSNNPHVPTEKNLDPHIPSEDSPEEEDPHPLLKSTIPPMGGITSEEAPMEEKGGSHTGGRKKKEKPIWEDPKRWYAETMGEVPKIEWQPREEARDEVQKRLSDGLE